MFKLFIQCLAVCVPASCKEPCTPPDKHEQTSEVSQTLWVLNCKIRSGIVCDSQAIQASSREPNQHDPNRGFQLQMCLLKPSGLQHFCIVRYLLCLQQLLLCSLPSCSCLSREHLSPRIAKLGNQHIAPRSSVNSPLLAASSVQGRQLSFPRTSVLTLPCRRFRVDRDSNLQPRPANPACEIFQNSSNRTPQKLLQYSRTRASGAQSFGLSTISAWLPWTLASSSPNP